MSLEAYFGWEREQIRAERAEERVAEVEEHAVGKEYEVEALRAELCRVQAELLEFYRHALANALAERRA